jgi:hypothetical protein
MLRLLSLLLSALPATMQAQQPDSLAASREFMQVCHSYKRLPLQLDVSISSSANLVTAAKDTLSLRAAFYMDEHGSYTRMGEMEQVANDSLLLLVSHGAHQMLLYANHSSLAHQLQSYMGLNLDDSSLAGFAGRYTVAAGPAKEKHHSYSCTSRALLAGTALPRETIQVLFDPGTQEPVEFAQRKRSLVAIDSADYAGFSVLPEWKGRLAKLANGWWAVKEVSTVYRYAAITHKKNLPLPVRITDRVLATAPGVYAPVKQYQQFVLNQFPEESTR